MERKEKGKEEEDEGAPVEHAPVMGWRSNERNIGWQKWGQSRS